MRALPDDERVLVAGPWFATLTAAVQRAVLEAGTVRTLPPGTALFDQEGGPTGIHGVLTGEVRIVGTSQEGNTVIMGIVRPGEWMGFLSALDGFPHSFAGIAREGARILSISRASIADIFERDVATYKLLQAPELAACRKLHRYLIEEIGLPLAQRVAARLGDLGRWPYGPPSGPVSALKSVSQEELAMSVGATRPRINEILRDFAGRGMIELGYGRITVIDAAAVDRFARSP